MVAATPENFNGFAGRPQSQRDIQSARLVKHYIGPADWPS
jgi:hypothetical protein